MPTNSRWDLIRRLRVNTAAGNPNLNVFSWFAIVIGVDVTDTHKTLQGHKINVI